MDNLISKYEIVEKSFFDWAMNRKGCTLSDAKMKMKSENCLCLPYFDQSAKIGLNNACVRIDKDNFVPDDEVRFDVSRIDDVLNVIVGEVARPFRSIGVDELKKLPEVAGYEWNLYLLTSYCWRFSDRFEFIHFYRLPHVSPVGAIVRKSLRYYEKYRNVTRCGAYQDLLKDVVLKAEVPLDEELMLKWLKSNKWLVKSCNVAKRIIASLSER